MYLIRVFNRDTDYFPDIDKVIRESEMNRGNYYRVYDANEPEKLLFVFLNGKPSWGPLTDDGSDIQHEDARLGVLRKIKADAWEKGYRSGKVDGYYQTNEEKNPFL